MANEKQKTVRILQSTQKKPISPMLYVMAGFFAGIFFIGIAGFMYFSIQPHPEYATQHTEENLKKNDEQNNERTETLPDLNHPAQTHPQHAYEVKGNEDDDNRKFDNDLLNAFKHPKIETPAIQRPSPFAAKAQAPNRQVPAAVVKKKYASAVKNTPSTQTSLVKNTQSTQLAPEIEGPLASIQITVTQTVSAVKDPLTAP